MKKIPTFLTLVAIIGIMLLPSVASSQQLPQTPAAPPQNVTLGQAKSKLLNSLNLLKVHFQNTQQKAATLTNLTQLSSSNADMVALMQGYLNQIDVLAGRINNAQNIAQLKDIAKQIHLLIQDAKQSVKKNISKRVAANIDRFTARSNNAAANLIKRATNKLMQLKNWGYDTAQMQTDLAQCQQLMDKGAQELQDAKMQLNLIENSSQQAEDPNPTLMKDALGTVKDARTTYSQARQNCLSVIRELKVAS